MMNSSEKGNAFEERFCEMLSQAGFFVHRLTPDHRGAQPFDVIAMKDNTPYAFECKTCAGKRFPLSRVEDNQVMAMEAFMQAGNPEAWFAFQRGDDSVWMKKASDVLLAMRELVEYGVPTSILPGLFSFEYWLKKGHV